MKIIKARARSITRFGQVRQTEQNIGNPGLLSVKPILNVVAPHATLQSILSRTRNNQPVNYGRRLTD